MHGGDGTQHPGGGKSTGEPPTPPVEHEP
jgi:hypothetical protein